MTVVIPVGTRGAEPVAQFPVTISPAAEHNGTRDPNLSDEGVRRALARCARLDLTSASIEELARAIQEQFGINTFVDTVALDNHGFGEIEITYHGKEIPLRSSLGLILEPQQLAFVVRCDSLVFTTPDEAENYAIAVAYDVTDILGTVPKQFVMGTRPIAKQEACPQPGPDFDSLIELITSTIDPSTWPDGTGPPGGICQYSVGNRHLLVILQTEKTHRAIGELLSTIRKIVGEDGATENVSSR